MQGAATAHAMPAHGRLLDKAEQTGVGRRLLIALGAKTCSTLMINTA